MLEVYRSIHDSLRQAARVEIIYLTSEFKTKNWNVIKICWNVYKRCM